MYPLVTQRPCFLLGCNTYFMEQEQPDLMSFYPDVPPFEKCVKLIEASINGLELTTQFVKLPQVEQVVEYLKIIQKEFPPSYVSFIMQNYPPKAGVDYYMQLNDTVTWKLSVEVITKEIPKANKKWYRIFKNQ